ncbi:SDR family NAD(P)-dependent oxidoreductase [Amycolatopsis methanolica]|uniref:Short-chain dehydrogenase/reductase SDR n=1 Tax=Amycolatopsis methanolica 239 TaxID=1068978 RepID=A0A076MRY8_AMYME|nr:Short-chain dehydrogenase/reductase SDR [Amycolatopsis methanolica 239]
MTTDIAPIGLLTGKVVFITGAGRGIGEAAARLFAREGAAVVLAARDAVPLDRAGIRAAIARPGSYTDDWTAPATTAPPSSAGPARSTPPATRTSTSRSR